MLSVNTMPSKIRSYLRISFFCTDSVMLCHPIVSLWQSALTHLCQTTYRGNSRKHSHLQCRFRYDIHSLNFAGESVFLTSICSKIHFIKNVPGKIWYVAITIAFWAFYVKCLKMISGNISQSLLCIIQSFD